MTQHGENLYTAETLARLTHDLSRFSPAVAMVNARIEKNVIRQIMKLVHDQTMRCQINIVSAAQVIAMLPDDVSPTVERRQLPDVFAKLAAAQEAIDALPVFTRHELRGGFAAIAETAKHAAKIANKITAKRNDASPKRYTIAEQKRIAAKLAAELVTEHAALKGHKQTKAVNDIAALLFERKPAGH